MSAQRSGIWKNPSPPPRRSAILRSRFHLRACCFFIVLRSCPGSWVGRRIEMRLSQLVSLRSSVVTQPTLFPVGVGYAETKRILPSTRRIANPDTRLSGQLRGIFSPCWGCGKVANWPVKSLFFKLLAVRHGERTKWRSGQVGG